VLDRRHVLEALNIAAPGPFTVIVVNDNGAPTADDRRLAVTWRRSGYPSVTSKCSIIRPRSHTPFVGAPLFETLHGIKKGLKDVLQPQVLFEDLGLKYLGPVDGHDEQTVEHALRRARDFGGPVLVHVITRKGFGYPLAEENDEDCLHQVSPAKSAKPAAALAVATPASRPWTQIFGDELAAIGAERPDVVAITAAIAHQGLAGVRAARPGLRRRVAEQHASPAVGLASAACIRSPRSTPRS
jgi:1-deoxy-D-xylulose-5-phosphate synthase